jgi:prepilin-type N-terminal cleavage/methylation domain-containing protein
VESQRGFSLVEIVVASAIAFTIGALLVWLSHTTILAASHLDARLTARSTVDRFTERLAAGAASAWSVFVPARDVLGNANGDGHELDFVSEDAAHESYWQAYDYDARAAQVTAYAYAPGTTPVAGDVYAGIAGFAAETHPLTDLADPASDAYDPLFAGDTLVPVDVPFDWGGNAVGGNHLVRVRVAAVGIDRTTLLSSGSAPSHFTVVVDYTPAPPTPTP